MKKVKFILPLVAIVFAVVGVFATENSNHTGGDVTVTLGYLASPQNCVADGTCTNNQPTVSCIVSCVTSHTLVLNIRGGAESCSSPATGTWTSDH